MSVLIYGLKVTFLGMGIVFISLVFLILVINLMAKLLTPKQVISKEPALEVKEPTEAEIIAVITAAIACLKSEQAIRIKTIRRLSAEGVPLWSAISRQEIMSGRQTR